MNDRPRIGIVGGYGAVGRSAARELRRFRLRIGGRNEGEGQAFVESLGNGAEWLPMDAHDPRSLATFCSGCDCIVNCAGPARELGDGIGRAAIAANAFFIDSSGFGTADLPPPRKAVALAAGMYPGLTGLLPRYLAKQAFDRPIGLTAWVGGCDHLSRVAAADYLDSLASGFGEAGTAWLGGKRSRRALATSGEEVSVPFFPGRVMLQPYFTAEAETLARDLGLSEVRWYSAFDGRQTLAALPLATRERDPDSLVSASQIDLFGREPYQILLFEMKGQRAGNPVTRRLLLRASSGAELTGVAVAAGAQAALAGELAPGTQPFAEGANPEFVVDRLRQAEAVRILEVLDGPVEATEEGAL